MEKFYMVYVEGRNAPSKKFERYQEAEEEALRLCEKEKSKVFVLESIVKFEMKNIVKTVLV